MRFLAAASLLFLSACGLSESGDTNAPKVAPILTSEDAVDIQTFAEPQKARVTHVDLDLELDFEQQMVSGSAMLDIIAEPDVDTVVLDNDGYTVETITDGEGKPLEYSVGEVVEGKGAPLTVTMGKARELTISYSAKDAAALQWLTPEQTAGGEHPYLFSQGQATLNRTWIPTQDSPGIRQTWSARITAPEDLTVVMSGLAGDEPEVLDDNRRAFTFEMDKPVAPYLIAIAAGDIVFQELGPRSGVWSEPSMIEAAAAELSDTEAMIDAAEKLYGEYRWGRYDMIVLPPAFPYGGMENPVMTFLTPTFIAGDRSLTGLIAHELAHSWSGNLVTNANWTDSWLNEGVTSYFENRIVEEIYGKKRADQEAALSFAAIEETLAEVGMDAPGTALHQEVNVDSIGSAIVYDKGAYFLRTVESIVGRDRFDAWLQQWFDNHAFQPATSAMILADLQENLVKDEAEAEKLMLREWIYEPGLPSNVAKPDPAAFAEVDAAAQAFADERTLDEADWAKWTSAERQRFLASLPRELKEAELAALDEALKLSTNNNNEELFLWLKLALENRYEAVVPTTETFLANVGRRKFVAPLFETLMEQGDWGQAIAKRTYAKTRPSYHSVTQGTVDGLVLGGSR
ncbi:M1 family metallopeptidase [Pontixanthobacter aestiaquae]|uniref:Aminopeptidase N n=1 Tax=Pontixanthobacter aestiaquae TaxID=1509367 RepID=A0A844Z464_9SPHN|nr:M1 family metallopeptidase [Pontixanthobacter aestiaquae]MDN3646294.1 M1 family metallopeptidase [Pontixanthobacter aestiaquae]MXO82715.1 aminopeptidase [Pontixanthobacter aestiaquae]